MDATHPARDAARHRHDALRPDPDTTHQRAPLSPAERRAEMRDGVRWARDGLRRGRLQRGDTMTLYIRALRAQHTASIQDARYGDEA